MIETADHDGIAVLTLNNGPVNALDLELLTAVPGSLAAVAAARAVVLTGSGRSFSAGVDLKQIADGGPPYIEKFLPALSLAMLTLFEHPAPVVAAVNGLALGGGFELALTCDMIVASESSQFGFPEIKIGLIPGGGGTQRLPRLVGPKTAKKIFMTGDPISPQEALRLNVAVEVVPGPKLMERSLELAGRMASMSPQALAALKRLVNMGTAGAFGMALPYERMMVTYLYDTDESRARVKDFVDKRKAR